MAFGGLVSGASNIMAMPVVAAFSLGLLTAISPCPLATNIAAIAYISNRVTERRYAISAHRSNLDYSRTYPIKHSQAPLRLRKRQAILSR